MDKNDAEIFTKLCGFCCTIEQAFHPIVVDIKDEIYSKSELYFMHLSHLDSIGLIKFEDLAGFRITHVSKKFYITYYGELLYLTSPKETDNDLDIGKVMFTKAGRELAQICSSQPVPGFKEYLKSKWQAFAPSDSV